MVEQWLVAHVSDGERLELVINEVGSEAEMLSWGESRTCRATVIRDILLGRLGGHPDPRGLRLRGARITGRLDLGNVTTGVNVELTDCLLEEGIIGQDARLASVLLTGCRIEHPSEPPLDGTRLTCSVLVLHRASVIGHSNGGAIRLSGASIGGQLDCSEATLRNDSGPALVADSLVVDQNVSLGARRKKSAA